MYSAYKLNKQSDNIQPWCTSFPIWYQSVVPCPILTVVSWPAYRFLRQVRCSGISISLRISHSLLWSIQSKGFGIVNKAEVDFFFGTFLLFQCWGHWVQQCPHGTFWRRLPTSSLPPPQFDLRSNNREGTQPCPSTENWIKDLLSMAPPIRTRPSFPLSHSLPSGSFHKPLILIHQRADRMKTTITKN